MDDKMLKELKRTIVREDKKLTTRFVFLLECLVRKFEQQQERIESMEMRYESTLGLSNRQRLEGEVLKLHQANRNLLKRLERQEKELNRLKQEV